jgi:hypothetical protein
MSFEQHRGSDSNDEHDDEMIDSVTNMDITIIDDGDEPMNYNGMDEELTQDFNVAATLTLKKNLNEAFEKHAGEVKKVGVKAKIQAFEEVNKEKKTGHNFSKTKVRFEAPAPRPPPVPVSKSQVNTCDDSRLSVYLRVRPLIASKDALELGHDVLQNTVEIIPSVGGEDTMIRTYPPIQSNASKVVRGPNHLHTHPINSDSKAVECAVKGVKEFQFNQVFGPDSSQEDVYESAAVPLVDGLFPKDDVKIVGDNIVGQSALLFTYGITNSGKTFTVMGKESSKESTKLYKYHGIIPRAMDHLLYKIDNLNKSDNNDVHYSLNMSYLEIYNEDIYDLLPKKSSANNSKYARCVGSFDTDNKLQLRDLRNGNIHVKGLTKYRVSSLAHGLTLTQTAKKKRHTSSNNINADSSRSHFICQFELMASHNNGVDNASLASEVSGYTANDDDSVASISNKPRSARFWVVDLAGSERSKRTGAFSRSTRQKEASLINSSLMNLMTCLRTLKNNQSSNSIRSKVPFRDSKLTHLFMGHLTGSAASRTSMIVNVNPSVADFDETQHVLCYAVDAKSVRIDKGEYNKKRQEIQPPDLHTHGQDGRPIKNRNKSPPRKMAKLAKKLSPRAILRRRREKKKTTQKKPNCKNKSGITGNLIESKEKPKPRLAGSKRKLEDGTKGLREELDTLRMKAAHYRKDAINLKEQLERCETEIRQELAEETEAQIEFTRSQHDEIVKRLKQQLQNVSQTPSKSAKKARMDKADTIIDELMDKLDEEEEEMARMRIEHLQLTTEHASELEQKDLEIEALQHNHAEEIAKYKEQISLLESRLENSDDLLLTEGDSDGEACFDGEGKENSGFGKVSNKGTPSSRSGLKRLPRGRCSEVACANISPPKDQPLSSNKKQRGMRLRPKHSPFKTLSANKKHSRSGSNVEDIIYPSVELNRDENGSFQRPRGRAPQGRNWDAEAGGWKLSILQS